VKFIGDIEMMCRRCHHIAGNHSGKLYEQTDIDRENYFPETTCI
jgi:hypothetical protein